MIKPKRVRQKVVSAEITTANVHYFSQWRLRLACGAITYRTHEIWNQGRGGKIHPAPKFVYCSCKKCRT